MTEGLHLIEWADSVGVGPGWRRPDEIENADVTIISVGWIVRETPSAVIIAPHYSAPSPESDAQVCGEMQIPKRAILRRAPLQEVNNHA